MKAPALVGALSSSDNGIVVGRRGTGKTHALRFLAEAQRAKGDFVVFIDIDRDLGSTGGLYSDPAIPIPERASRLLIDVLAIIHGRLLEEAFDPGDDGLISILESMLDHFGEVVVSDQAETERTIGTSRSYTKTASGQVSISASPSLQVGGSGVRSAGDSDTSRVKVSGPLRNRVHFGAVAGLMGQAINRLPASRCWLLFDEWSSLSLDIQPYLSEMLRRLFFGIPKVTNRIAVIPHRTEWRIEREDGSGYLGVEVGAQLFPLLDLDEFVFFRQEAATSEPSDHQRSLAIFSSCT